jgi:hypothetical protein
MRELEPIVLRATVRQLGDVLKLRLRGVVRAPRSRDATRLDETVVVIHVETVVAREEPHQVAIELIDGVGDVRADVEPELVLDDRAAEVEADVPDVIDLGDGADRVLLGGGGAGWLARGLGSRR